MAIVVRAAAVLSLVLDILEREKRELLHVDVAPPREAYSGRGLADDLAIGEIFASRRDPFYIEVALEVILDFRTAACLAGFAQVFDDWSEERGSVVRQVAIDRVERGLNALLRLLG